MESLDSVPAVLDPPPAPMAVTPTLPMEPRHVGAQPAAELNATTGQGAAAEIPGGSKRGGLALWGVFGVSLVVGIGGTGLAFYTADEPEDGEPAVTASGSAGPPVAATAASTHLEAEVSPDSEESGSRDDAGTVSVEDLPVEKSDSTRAESAQPAGSPSKPSQRKVEPTPLPPKPTRTNRPRAEELPDQPAAKSPPKATEKAGRSPAPAQPFNPLGQRR